MKLFVSGIEMGRKANACSGSIVDNELTAHQLFRDTSSFLMSQRDSASSLRRISGTSDFKPCLFGKIYQQSRLPCALFSNSFNANLVNDFVARLGGVQGRN